MSIDAKVLNKTLAIKFNNYIKTLKHQDEVRFTPRIQSWFNIQKSINVDFPGGSVVKNPPANAGDTGSIPGPGRSCMPRSN